MPNQIQPGNKYTFAQLEGLWIQAGGDRASAPIMAAIAMAESGGRVDAENKSNSDGSTDRGLWQINSVHGSLSTFDPMGNAKAAVKIKGTQGLKAWTVYRTGAYKEFLNGNTAIPPDTNGLPSGSTSTANQASVTGDIGGAIGKGLGDAFKAVIQPMMSMMIWSGEILFGILLMLGGIIVFIVNTEAGKKGSRTVVDAATLAAAPEAAPELRSAQTAARMPATARSAASVRTVRSKEEFRRLRQSGYQGPVRHDYRR